MCSFDETPGLYHWQKHDYLRSATRSTTGPRAVLIRIDPRGIWARAVGPIRWLVESSR